MKEDKSSFGFLKEDKKSNNRVVCFPYTKNMVARDEVDQAAFVCLMSFGEAKKWGVPEENIVFLHGSGDCFENDFILQRQRIDTSLAMKRAFDEALRSSSVRAKDISLFDIYSCFPVAVEVALSHLSISREDVGRLTQTGGLPYHGGPGSNYSCHGLCALIENLRKERDSFGMLCANGGMMTEHSAGVYSCVEPNRKYLRRPLEEYSLQEESKAVISSGKTVSGKVLCWTVEFRRNKKSGGNEAERGVIIGETYNKERFVAVSKDNKEISWLLQEDRSGSVVSVDFDSSLFTFHSQQSNL